MKVEWTNSALESFEAEQTFILKKWNLKEVIKFIQIVDDFVRLVESDVFIGMHRKDNVYAHVISKQTTVYFRRVNNGRIELLLFWNNLQNPETLKQLLKA